MTEIEIDAAPATRKCVFIDAELHYKAKVAAAEGRVTLRGLVEAALIDYMKGRENGSGAQAGTS